MNKEQFLSNYLKKTDCGKKLMVDYKAYFNTISVPIDNIVDDMCLFDFSSKRGYVNLLDYIEKDVKIIMDNIDNGDYFFRLLGYKMYFLEKINNRTIENIVSDDFMEIYNIIRREFIVDDVLDFISDYIEKTYDFDLEVPSKKEINVELQITNAHAICFNKAAMASRVYFPIFIDVITKLSSYTDINGNKLDTDDIMNIVDKFITDLLDYYSTTVDTETGEIKKVFNLNNKMYKIADSRIKATYYSNKDGWYYNTNVSKSPNNFTLEVKKALTLEIIPKFVVGQSIVSLMHVVTKNKLDHMFRTNYPLEFSSKNQNNSETKGTCSIEKLEINKNKVNKNNEGILILEDLSIKQEINKLCKLYDITNDELEYIIQQYNTYLNITAWQIKFLSKVYSRHGIGTVSELDRHSQIALLILTSYILKERNCPNLSLIILSNPQTSTRNVGRGTATSKKLLETNKNKTLDKILDDKFASFKRHILEKGLLKDELSSILCQIFKYVTIDGEEDSILEIDDAEVISEYIRCLEGVI